MKISNKKMKQDWPKNWNQTHPLMNPNTFITYMESQCYIFFLLIGFIIHDRDGKDIYVTMRKKRWELQTNTT